MEVPHAVTSEEEWFLSLSQRVGITAVNCQPSRACGQMYSANLSRHRGWFLWYKFCVCCYPCPGSVHSITLAMDVLGVSCCPAMWEHLCMQMDGCARTAALGMHRVTNECIAPTVIIGRVDIADLHSNLFWRCWWHGLRYDLLWNCDSSCLL